MDYELEAKEWHSTPTRYRTRAGLAVFLKEHDARLLREMAAELASTEPTWLDHELATCLKSKAQELESK